MKNYSIIRVLIIAVAVIGACFVLGYFYLQSKQPQKVVSVIGLAEKDFESDLIVWNSEYSIKAENLKEAYTLLQTQTDIVKKYLAEKEIKDQEFNFSEMHKKK